MIDFLYIFIISVCYTTPEFRSHAEAWRTGRVHCMHLFELYGACHPICHIAAIRLRPHHESDSDL